MSLITKKHLTHLRQLEAESIHIFREVVAEFNNPTMLYSIGKDSSVMLHLAKKAFFPAQIPFKLLHVDTGHNFPETIHFRDQLINQLEVNFSCTRTRKASPRASGRLLMAVKNTLTL